MIDPPREAIGDALAVIRDAPQHARVNREVIDTLFGAVNVNVGRVPVDPRRR